MIVQQTLDKIGRINFFSLMRVIYLNRSHCVYPSMAVYGADKKVVKCQIIKCQD